MTPSTSVRSFPANSAKASSERIISLTGPAMG